MHKFNKIIRNFLKILIIMLIKPADPNNLLHSSANVVLNTTQNSSYYKILNVKTRCSQNMLISRFELNRPYRGLIYAKDFPLECRARGNNKTQVTLRLPSSSCGVRLVSLPNGDLELTVNIILQSKLKLHQRSDILYSQPCKLPANETGMILDTGPMSKDKVSNFRVERMNFVNSNSGFVHLRTPTNSTQSRQQKMKVLPGVNRKKGPHIRIWLEVDGKDKTGIVEVGETTTLKVRAVTPGLIDLRVVDCVALDGLGQSMQQLLNQHGCPTDENVMPALNHVFRPIDEGWSKQSDDDLVEHIFSSTFPAFKFPDRERLHLSCAVLLCERFCANLNCNKSMGISFRKDEVLARIEVFNSLAVLPPQIEMDLIHYSKNFNKTNYSHYMGQYSSNGILCISISKLAISFCILGVIILVAVIVAVLSLLRARNNYLNGARSAGRMSSSFSDGMQHTELCLSTLSSSTDSIHSGRFGNIFLSYYTQTLPYGRVY